YFQLTFTTNYLLSLRLITLASEDLIYYSLRPTTQTTTQSDRNKKLGINT
ncbi:hypothetical protein K456DRAFT_59588, partial [Colletotrichum gloeosporioides 23]